MFRTLTTAAAIALACTTITEAKTWSGKWGGESRSTLTFLANKQVRYCFKSRCAVRSYVGDPEKSIRFRWGNASFSFKRTGTGYSGTFRAGSDSSSIQMK